MDEAILDLVRNNGERFGLVGYRHIRWQEVGYPFPWYYSHVNAYCDKCRVKLPAFVGDLETYQGFDAMTPIKPAPPILLTRYDIPRMADYNQKFWTEHYFIGQCPDCCTVLIAGPFLPE